jgi:hypothetical protein
MTDAVLPEHFDVDGIAAKLAEVACRDRISRRTVFRYMNEPDGLQYAVIAGKRVSTLQWIAEFIDRRRHRPNPRRKAA